MKRLLGTAAALTLMAGAASAQGELQLYNWGNYTNPELLEKFEAETGISVTVTDYDSNDTALSRVRAGGHGFDLVVPSGTYVPIWIEEGLVSKVNASEMENFHHVAERWKNVDYDPGREYTVPWQWGSVGITVNTSVYDGDIHTAALIFDPPEELKGRINVIPEMNDVVGMAINYVGGEQCTDDLEILQKARDALLNAKPHWLSINYGNIENFVTNDVSAGIYWNGASLRVRLQNEDVHYGYPQEGFPIWTDNLMLLNDARNVDEAKAFMNFVMHPENAALISDFARYANSIEGSEEFMDPVMTEAPEVIVPEELADAGYLAMTCSPEVQRLYSAIWTEVVN